MSKIYFRADGNSKMGLGHVIRSIALVDMLKSKFECIFIIRKPSSLLKAEILESCSTIIELENPESDIIEATAIAKKISKDDIVVLDGYHFDMEYQREIKKSSCKLVSIDDIFSCHFLSDVVINHSPGLDIDKYSIEDYTSLKLGVDYALLRKPFLDKGLEARNVEKIENVFVCFGGSDFNNITGKVVSALAGLKGRFKTINVVLGSAYLYEEQLNSLLKNKEAGLRLHRNLSAVGMANLMESCQLGIVPSSSILYEVCSVGMHVISGYYVDNQVNVNKGFSELNLVHSLGDFNKIEDLSLLIKNYLDDLNNDQLLNQAREFDGKSGERLLAIFSELYYSSFAIREASEADCDQYFEWANDRSVRMNAINQEEIEYESHCKWFKSKLKTGSTKMYILEKSGSLPVGQIRFDISSVSALISYSLDKEWRGKRLGSLLVKKGLSNFIADKSRGLSEIVAEVKSNNIASIKVFERLNFHKISTVGQEKRDLEMYKLYLS